MNKLGEEVESTGVSPDASKEALHKDGSEVD